MPLPLKSLSEAAVELGIPEAEIKALVDLRKVRGMLKKGKLHFAPDELAKIKHLRRTLPESVIKSSASEVAAQQKVTPPKPTTVAPPPRRPPPSRRIGG